jgi:ATP-dependent Clp protease ATP-binding subunit ClpB
MTSNLGGQQIQDMAGHDFGDVQARVQEILRDHFRPEFLNRVDEIIVFRSLTREQIGAIVDIQVRRLQERLAERKVELRLTDAARTLLGERGWDPTYGARPLKRAIQRLVQDPLAVRLLQGEFGDGDTVEVDAEGGQLSFRKVEAPEPLPVG